jgi:BTB/POZ domain
MSETKIVEKSRFDHSRFVKLDLFADVTFTFPHHNESSGDAPSVVKAHKILLSSVSSVFNTMFCDLLPPTTNEVTIEDISRNDFIEVLRHIYGSEAIISFDNVYRIWSAAQKYSLAELTKKCANYICELVFSFNVLEIFNNVQLFDNDKIDKKCLQVLLDSPQQYFEADGIEKMNKDAFRKFVVVLKDNCSAADLKAIALKWLNNRQQTQHCCFSNQVQQIFAKEFNIDSTHFEIEEIKINPVLDVNYLDSTLFQRVMNDSVVFSNHTHLSQLHGIGIYVGCHPDDVPAGNSEWIVVEVRELKVELWSGFGSKSNATIMKKTLLVHQEPTPSILPIRFDPFVPLSMSKFSISIRFPNCRRRAINPMSWKNKTLGKLSLSAESTCLAYLIENPDVKLEQ